MADNISNGNISTSTFHNFNIERLLIQVLGGYVIIKKPQLHFCFNLAFITCIVLLYFYLFCMGVYGIAIAADETILKVQIFQTLCFLTSATTMPTIKFLWDSNVNTALSLLRNGIYQYKEEPDLEYQRIKTQRVAQIKSFSSYFTVVCYFCAFSNTIQSPLIQLLTSNEDVSEALINPYLPLPIYMPFDTRTVHGYIIAFISNGLFLMIFYTSISCLTESYLSFVLQLIAQLEILNHSLRHIEDRALTKLEKERSEYFGTEYSRATVYDKTEFQKNLYLCLQANIQHHQAILKYAKEIKGYLETMNSLCLLIFALMFASSIVTIIQDPKGNMAQTVTLLVEMTGYLQLFWAGQFVTDMSAETINSLYSTPWPFCNKSYNVLLVTMMTNTKVPIVLRSPVFGANMSLQTFGELLSGGYKLVNVLLSTL